MSPHGGGPPVVKACRSPLPMGRRRARQSTGPPALGPGSGPRTPLAAPTSWLQCETSCRSRVLCLVWNSFRRYAGVRVQACLATGWLLVDRPQEAPRRPSLFSNAQPLPLQGLSGKSREPGVVETALVSKVENAGMANALRSNRRAGMEPNTHAAGAGWRCRYICSRCRVWAESSRLSSVTESGCWPSGINRVVPNGCDDLGTRSCPHVL